MPADYSGLSSGFVRAGEGSLQLGAQALTVAPWMASAGAGQTTAVKAEASLGAPPAGKQLPPDRVLPQHKPSWALGSPSPPGAFRTLQFGMGVGRGRGGGGRVVAGH